MTDKSLEDRVSTALRIAMDRSGADVWKLSWLYRNAIALKKEQAAVKRAA